MVAAQLTRIHRRATIAFFEDLIAGKGAMLAAVVACLVPSGLLLFGRFVVPAADVSAILMVATGAMGVAVAALPLPSRHAIRAAFADVPMQWWVLELAHLLYVLATGAVMSALLALLQWMFVGAASDGSGMGVVALAWWWIGLLGAWVMVRWAGALYVCVSAGLSIVAGLSGVVPDGSTLTMLILAGSMWRVGSLLGLRMPSFGAPRVWSIYLRGLLASRSGKVSAVTMMLLGAASCAVSWKMFRLGRPEVWTASELTTWRAAWVVHAFWSMAVPLCVFVTGGHRLLPCRGAWMFHVSSLDVEDWRRVMGRICAVVVGLAFVLAAAMPGGAWGPLALGICVAGVFVYEMLRAWAGVPFPVMGEGSIERSIVTLLSTVLILLIGLPYSALVVTLAGSSAIGWWISALLFLGYLRWRVRVL